MLRIDRQSNCKDCALDCANRVVGISSNSAPRIVVLGEAPGSIETQEKKPFVGPAGKELRKLLKLAGLKPEGCYLTNAILCQPPENAIDSIEGESAKENCAGGLKAELTLLHKRGARVILAVGDTAMKALGVEGSVFRNRGSIFSYEPSEGRSYWVVPTFHPSYIIRGNWNEEPTAIADIEKVMRIANTGWTPPEENFLTQPTIESLQEIVSRIQPGSLLGFDIEATSLDPRRAKLVVAGVATSPTTAFSIPFYKQGGGMYWGTTAEFNEARKILQYLLDNFQMIVHNAQYDFAVLRALKYKTPIVPHDTMLMHHSYHPELPHKLGYVASIYAETPYWKDVVLNSESVIFGHDDNVLRTYNLRDAVVLPQIFSWLKEELVSTDTWKVYEETAQRLLWPCMHMQEYGMRLLTNRLPAWKEEVSQNKTLERKRFLEAAGALEGFNPNSQHHMRWLLFREKPSSYKTKLAEFNEYENPGTKKRKNTKKYAELAAFIEAFTVEPACTLKMTYHTTESGGYEVTTKSLTAMKIAAAGELDQIGKFRKPRFEHRERATELQRLLTIIEAYLKYRMWAKLESTYTDFPVGSDGRVHPQYKITGTVTGRLSSEGPNWQNLPKIVRKLFGPAEGNVFVGADFSNIELRVLAHETGDTVLQAIFDSGRKVHDENVKLLFGLTPDHPMFEFAKRAAKIYIFGRVYGGGLYSIYERVSAQVPELRLTFARFKEIDEAYRKAHPAYVKWVAKVTKKAETQRLSETAFGRKRWLLGAAHEITREALNTPIQGTAADAANKALIEVDAWCESRRNFRVVNMTHDSIMVECPAKDTKKVAAKLQQIMESPLKLWNKVVRFPVSVEVFPVSWGEPMSLEDYLESTHTASRPESPAKITESADIAELIGADLDEDGA